MIRRPFLIFNLIVGTLVASLIWFVQTPQFARAVKTISSRYLPKDIGIEGDFSELSVKIFPPGLSIKNPRLILREHNIANLPAGSSVEAERIDIIFRLFQIFSGDIRVHELSIVNGDIQLMLDGDPTQKPRPRGKSLSEGFHWDELLQVRADAVGLNNVRLKVQLKGNSHSPGQSIETTAQKLLVSQWEGRGGLGYYVSIDLRNTRSAYLKEMGLPESVESVRGEAYLNALGLQLQSLLVSDHFENARMVPRQPMGLEISASGQLKGNILNPKKLISEIEINMKGDIGKILRATPKFRSVSELPEGIFALSGKIQGNILEPMSSLHAEGHLSARDLSFQRWKADAAKVDAKWEASPSGGELIISKASFASREIPRMGGHQPGGGGKLEVGPIRWGIGTSAPVKIPVHLERAHLHWLAAAGIKSVYPLDFRVTGNAVAVFSPATHTRSWDLQTQLELFLDGFQLDNQRYLQEKPLTRLFKIPRLRVAGPVAINSAEIRPSNLIISMPHSKFNVNGKISFKTGYDLYASSTIHLEEVGQLAENEIRGEGSIGVHVHGPASGVLIDLDTDFKDAYYLNLALGRVKGRIVWDDDLNHLYFNKVQVTKNSTHCVVDGLLELGKNDSVSLNTTINDGNIQDLTQIFARFTQSLSWFPADLNGPVEGNIQVSGGISMSKLIVLSHLKGRNWERWGERFRKVDLIGGYDRGKYHISEINATKKNGIITGRISYDADQKLSWNFSTANFTLGDFDHIVQLDVPVRGNLEVESSGTGVDGKIESSTEASLDNFSVRGTWMPSSHFSWKTGAGVSHVQVTAMGGQGLLDILYDFNPKGLSSFHGELKQLDFTPILLLLNPKSIQDKALAGSISGNADFTFHAGEFERANGSFAISDYLLSRSDAKFVLANPVSAQVLGGNCEVNHLTLKGKTGEVSLDIVGRNAGIEGRIRGNLDTAFVEFFTPTVVKALGTSTVDLAIGGVLKEPVFSGTANLEGGTIRIASLDSPFENVTGSLQIRKNVLYVQNLRADLGGGTVTTEGNILFYPDRYPKVMLKGKIDGSKVKIFPFQYALVKGSLGVQGEGVPYLVDGAIMVDSALCKEKVFTQKSGSVGLKTLPYAPPLSGLQESGSSRFKLNIDVNAERGIFIQNDLFRDVEAKGSMTVVNTLESPKVLGHAEAIRGKLIFKDHVFQIQNATAKFDNPNVINPSFDLNASTEVNGIKIQMYASGRLNKINKIELTSNPAMQESEILSLLAVGLTSIDAKKLSSIDHNVVQQGEVTSLLLHSLDFNRDFEDKTGFQVQLDESVNPQQGVSVFRPQSQTDTIVAPQITIRKKLGERLSLSAGSTVGVGSNKSNQVNLDFFINRDMSLSGVYSNYGVSGTADAQQNTQNSTGLDLKFQKRFK